MIEDREEFEEALANYVADDMSVEDLCQIVSERLRESYRQMSETDLLNLADELGFEMGGPMKTQTYRDWSWWVLAIAFVGFMLVKFGLADYKPDSTKGPQITYIQDDYGTCFAMPEGGRRMQLDRG